MLFVIADLANFAFAFTPGTTQGELLFRSILTALALVLVLLGLVGLYARQAEVTGLFGLLSFLVTFAGLVLTQSFTWAALFRWGIHISSVGWLLFGLVSLRTRVYPPATSLLLIFGAGVAGLMGIGVVSSYDSGGPDTTTTTTTTVVFYERLVGDIILSGAIAWLGWIVFTGREAQAQGPTFTRGGFRVLRGNILNIIALRWVFALAGLLLVVLVGLLVLQMLFGGCRYEGRAALEEFPHYGDQRIEPYPGEGSCNVRYPTAASREEVLGYYDEQLRENGWEGTSFWAPGPPNPIEVYGDDLSDISGAPESVGGGLRAQRDGYRYGVTYEPPGTGDSAEDAQVLVEVTDEPGDGLPD